MTNQFSLECGKHPSDKSCTVTTSGALEEVVELGCLDAKTRHCHKDEEEKASKDWIRDNTAEAND